MADVVSLLARQTRAAKNRNSLDEHDEVGGSGELSLSRAPHKLDSPTARAEHRQLLQWFYYERDRQAGNRLEMAMDHDFYDGDQWDPEDKAIVESRGQKALVYNEVAPMADWLIGTERRNRVDWKVLPRTEDDVQLADVKTKALKYVSDVNKVVYARSRAFADAIKGGEGWVDDGVRDDPTQDILYSRYEDWRNVLGDSAALDLAGEDMRYIFRWRWVDEDVALMMFPDRADVIRSAIEDWAYYTDPEDDDLSANTPLQEDASRRGGSLNPLASSTSGIDAQRRRVKLIECQYRKPVATKFVADGPLKGALFDPRDKAMASALASQQCRIIDRIVMRMHVAVFTEEALLGLGVSVYRHNRASLTRLVCYRRSRDRMPYGVIRRVRGIQEDLNKRASKALWLVNTNQLIGDKDAFDDWDEAAEEAQMPDGRLKINAGRKAEIRRDTDAATGQLQIMTMAAQSIQKSAGVTDENLGRKTNAISGEAIKARQMQGSVVTTEPFDNLRLATQHQGEKQLSLIEQFYTQEKVLRLTGVQGGLEWVRINQPEVQPDGTVRYLNDVTASMADFIVSEADYAGTLRQVMFEQLSQFSQRLPPEVAMKLLRIAFEFSDLPNKQEITDELRRMTGERDPNKEMTPEEAQQAEQQMQAQSEAMQIQRQAALAALEEQQAKVREVNARVEKMMAEIEALRAGPAGEGDGGVQAQMQLEMERGLAQVREQSAAQVEDLSRKLAEAKSAATAKVLEIKAGADTAAEVARINADAEVRVAEIQRVSDSVIEKLNRRLDDMTKAMGEQAKELLTKIDESQKTIKQLEKAAAEPVEPKAAEPAAAAAAQQQPVTVVVQQPQAAAATVRFESGPDGKLKGAVLTREDGTELKVDVEGGAKPAGKEK